MLQKYVFSISDGAMMIFLSYPEGQLIGSLHCKQTKPCYFSLRDRFNFKHVILHSDSKRHIYIHTGLDKENIQIKYCAKVQLLVRLVILASQFHTGKDYKYTAKKEKIVFLNPLGYC